MIKLNCIIKFSVDKTARNAACWNAQPGANTVMVTNVGC